MTTPESDDRAAPPDPRLDAAWRAASNEAPPAALDAAILAAARREVRAGPRGARAQMPMDVHRRWWPLAAAATIAAIAVGVLELVTPDQLSAPSLDGAIVSDMPANAKPALDTMTAAPREEASKEAAGNPGAVADNAGSGGAASGGANPQSAARQEGRAPGVAQQDDAAKASANAQRRDSSGEAQRAAPSSDAQRFASPFPAAPATSPVAASPPSPGPADSPSSAAASAQASARKSEAMSALEAPAPPAAPAATRASAPAPASGPSLNGQMSEPSAPLAKAATAGASADQTADARVKDRTPLPVADWIALIRRLRAEGKLPEAAKELAAFRAAHADHENLLPPDLRNWHPPTQ